MDNEEKNQINFDDDTINNDDKENIDSVDIYSGTFKGRDSLSENNIVDEIKKSFLDYSMSVITSRALPDLRDGLKPVHRRILWSKDNSSILLLKSKRPPYIINIFQKFIIFFNHFFSIHHIHLFN